MSSKSSSKAKISPKRVLPFFIWLLRDVVLRLPPECNSFREYLQKKVWSTKTLSNFDVTAKRNKVISYTNTKPKYTMLKTVLIIATMIKIKK